MSDEKPSTAHCETECYVVEARSDVPREVGGHLVGESWRRLRFERAPIGVPHGLFALEAARLGYMSYESAMALAYWFASEAQASCVQIRLVRYKFVQDYTVTKQAEEAPIEHGGLRRLHQEITTRQASAEADARPTERSVAVPGRSRPSA